METACEDQRVERKPGILTRDFVPNFAAGAGSKSEERDSRAKAVKTQREEAAKGIVMGDLRSFERGIVLTQSRIT